jgi:hypothetical protein
MEPHDQSSQPPSPVFEINGAVTHGQSNVHYGNNFFGNYSSNQNQTADDDEDDEFLESLELPPNWVEAESDERDYYVDTIAGTTTWVKPVPELAKADIEFRERLQKEFGGVVEPDIKIVENTGGSRSTASNEPNFLEIVKSRAREANVQWPNR